jgi:hypothetical protein
MTGFVKFRDGEAIAAMVGQVFDARRDSTDLNLKIKRFVGFVRRHSIVERRRLRIISQGKNPIVSC